MIRLAEAAIEIAAEPGVVFDLFSTEVGLCRWMADEASVDLRPGGAWRWVHDNGNACSGEYLDVDPPSRLAFTYGWENGEFADVAPGSTRVDVTFEPFDGGTRVVVEHAQLVGDRIAQHQQGWTHFLGRLAATAEGDMP
jgi:uncharacterized protein YndB with AHSA1/START domain